MKTHGDTALSRYMDTDAYAGVWADRQRCDKAVAVAFISGGSLIVIGGITKF